MRWVAGGVFVAGVGAGFGAWALDPRPWFGPSLAASALLSALLVWIHVVPERVVPVRGGMESVQLDAAVLVPILLLAGAAGSLLAIAVASVAGGLVARRTPVKLVFNLGQLLFSTAVGVLLVGRLGGGSAEVTSVTSRELLVAMGAVLAVETLSAVAVALMVMLVTGSPLATVIDLRNRLVPWSGGVLLGGVGTVASLTSPVVTALVIGLVAVVRRAYGTSVTAHIARRRAEELQRVVAALRAHTDSADVRRDVLAAARDLMGAEHVELTSRDDQGRAGSLGVPLGAERLVVSRRKGAGTWNERDRRALGALAGVAGDVLRATELVEKLHTVTTCQSEGVIAVGMDGRVTLVNPSASRLIGLPSTDLTGWRVDELLEVTYEGRRIDISAPDRATPSCADLDGELLTRQMTEPLPISYTLTRLMRGGQQVGAVFVFRDATERRALQQELTRQALHDDLTGLPNRRLLLDRLDKALQEGASHGLLFFDLDWFKRVNDSYGHAAGDELLVQVASRVRQSVGERDTVSRLSGDEFVVLVEDVRGIEQLTTVADRLIDVLADPFEVRGHEVVISASIGVAISRPDDDRDGLLAAADIAAYQAKNKGRNCHHVAVREDSEAARIRMALEADLRHAVDRGELEVYFQPIIDTAADSVQGVEALIRWNRPGHGLVAPLTFIPLAEETGLIVPIGRWILGEACRTVRAWTDEHPEHPPLTLSVNLSSRQFAHQRLVDEVAAVLRDTGLPPQRLCLEITESVMMADTSSTRATLRRLRELGVRLAIDDFGTGYSSLSYLKDFPVDVVKIDRSFVCEIGRRRADTEIVAAVVRLATALGMDVVAEGVETSDQRERLTELGCSIMQGFLFSPPCPGDEFVVFWTGRATSAV